MAGVPRAYDQRGFQGVEKMSKVVLIQIDGKEPNLALMKLAKFHENKKDDVMFVDLSTLKGDIFYGSKIFMGGSGYNLKAKLPKGIEELVPDYDKFGLDYSVGFTSRGCFRNCDFCIVRKKEGFIHDVKTNWITKQKVKPYDNNFLACPTWKEKLQYFIDTKAKVCFNQGLDLRLVDEEKAEMLAKLNYRDDSFKTKRLYFAWDNIKDEEAVFKGVKYILEAGIKPTHLMLYMIVNNGEKMTDNLYKIAKMKELGIKPYVMVKNKLTADPIYKKLQRWVNRRYYNFIEWEDFGKKGSFIKETAGVFDRGIKKLEELRK